MATRIKATIVIQSDLYILIFHNIISIFEFLLTYYPRSIASNSRAVSRYGNNTKLVVDSIIRSTVIWFIKPYYFLAEV